MLFGRRRELVASAMKPGPHLLSVLLLWLLLAGTTPRSAPAEGQPRGVQHHGFFINLSRIEGKAGKEAVLVAVKRQIELVERAGLAPEVLEFFRSVPILLMPDSTGTPGLYSKTNKRVGLKFTDLGPDKPILLHELLHAYHDQILADGYENADVQQFYELALRHYRLSKSEYFLSNAREFFAVTASIYLHGRIERAPHDRRTIEAAQPLYWKYLEGLFGKRST